MKFVCLPAGLLWLASTLIPAAALGQESADPAKPILPGYWSYTASTVLSEASKGYQCVRPDKIDEFLAGPHNRHYRCTYPSKSVADGSARFDGECIGKHGEHYKVAIAGAYSLTRFSLKGKIHGTIFGMPLTLPISIDARRIGGECPAGSK